ncbi:MAG: HAD family hydrolase [Halobacteriales archaeon]
MAYEAVVFDNDGVLTHPTDRTVLRAATEAAFAAVGVDDPDEELLVSVSGNANAAETACARYDLDLERFWSAHERERVAAQRKALIAETKPLYDDVDTVRQLAVPCGIVSNNQHGTIEHIIDIFDLGECFETYYGRDPTLDGFRRRKPVPYYLEQALDDLGTRNALYVGDSRVDIIAADRAGVDSVFIRRPHREDYELTKEPTYRIESLTDLHAIIAGERSSASTSI